jgi:hypothetical protein
MRVLTLWLVAFWLPLTLHCELAAMDHGCCIEACCEDQPCIDNHPCCPAACPCSAVICKVIKTGNFSSREIKESIPTAETSYGADQNFFDHQSESAPANTLSEITSAPPEILRRWQFIFRATQAPRTPPASC